VDGYFLERRIAVIVGCIEGAINHLAVCSASPHQSQSNLVEWFSQRGSGRTFVHHPFKMRIPLRTDDVIGALKRFGIDHDFKVGIS